MKSVYDKLEKIRKPRVHITYDVETEGGAVKKELPFVVGVLGEFAGNASKVKKSLKERKFVQIDADNFNEVMNRIGPEIDLKVSNTLKNDNSEMAVHLAFNSIEDFEPGNIAKQIEPLRKLIETRNQLSELLSKADRSENLEGLLEKILQDSESLKKISADLKLNHEPEKSHE